MTRKEQFFLFCFLSYLIIFCIGDSYTNVFSMINDNKEESIVEEKYIINDEEKEIINNFITDFFIGLQDNNYLKLNSYLIDKEEITFFELNDDDSIIDVSIKNGYQIDNHYFIQSAIKLEGRENIIYQYFYVKKENDKYKLSINHFYDEVIKYPEVFKEKQNLFLNISYVLSKKWSKVNFIKLNEENTYNVMTDEEIINILDSEDLSKLEEDFYYNQLLTIYKNPFIANQGEVTLKYNEETKIDEYYFHKYILPKNIFVDKGLELTKINFKKNVFSEPLDYVFYGYNFENQYSILNLSKEELETYLSDDNTLSSINPTESMKNLLKSMTDLLIALVTITLIMYGFLFAIRLITSSERLRNSILTDDDELPKEKPIDSVENIKESVNSILDESSKPDLIKSNNTSKSLEKEQQTVIESVELNVERKIIVEESVEEKKDIELEKVKRKIQFDEE